MGVTVSKTIWPKIIVLINKSTLAGPGPHTNFAYENYHCKIAMTNG